MWLRLQFFDAAERRWICSLSGLHVGSEEPGEAFFLIFIVPALRQKM